LTFVLIHFGNAQKHPLSSGTSGAVHVQFLAKVDGGYPLEISPTDIDFGTVRLGDTKSTDVTFTNTGTVGIRFTQGTMPRGFTFSVFPSQLAPDASFIGTIVFKPDQYGF
jgi:hypothetical protein